MKKLILLTGVFVAAFFSYAAHAQVLRDNIDVQPLWGPTGYSHVEYYYLPDIDAYYDVPNHHYVYYNAGAWVNSTSLPPNYSKYDLYHGYKVVINDDKPWLHNDKYRRKYARYKNRHDQQMIRDSREEKYWANPEHPHHSGWHSSQHHFNDGPHGHN